MTTKAYDTYKLLHGVICTYKPPACSYIYVINRIKANICKELNLEESPPKPYIEIDRSCSELSVKIRPSYADNILCSGPRFQTHHFELNVVNPLCDLSTGVQLVCINDGRIMSEILKRLNFTRCYHIKGILGQATTNYDINSKVIARAKYEKVDRHKFEKILANYQSSTQRKLFDEYGFQLQSQEAYEFAVKGLYRPDWKGPPIIYSINIVDFEPPNFTLEVQCIHETEVFLKHLIHNLGLGLKCYATCTGMRCIRHGCFHVEHALVTKQWTVDEIIQNLKLCWDILQKNYPEKIKFSPTVTTTKGPINSLLDDK